MSKTNCVNCGAAKDTSEIRCPFCGTTYLDMTGIDFASGDPVVCQFVLPNHVRLGDSDNRVIMSMLAVPRLEEISMQANTTTVYGGTGHYPLASFTDSYDINIGVSFVPVIAKDRGNTLITLRIDE